MNYLVSERIKAQSYHNFYRRHYFWRNQQQAEIDYIEESDGQIRAFKFRWNEKRKVAAPVSFARHYPEATFTVVTRGNYPAFLTVKIHRSSNPL